MESIDSILFYRISIEDAQEKYRTFYQVLEEIRQSIETEKANVQQRVPAAEGIINGLMLVLMNGEAETCALKALQIE